MPAYLIADVEVLDQETYDEYKRRVAPVIAKFGGRFLVRGGSHVVLEGQWQPQRLVVVEFPTMSALTSWYESPEYAPLITLRKSASKGTLVAVEGT